MSEQQGSSSSDEVIYTILRLAFQTLAVFIGGFLLFWVSGQVGQAFFPALGVIPGIVLLFLSFKVAYGAVFAVMVCYLGTTVLRYLLSMLWRTLTPFIKRAPGTGQLKLDELSTTGKVFMGTALVLSQAILSGLAVLVLSMFAEPATPLWQATLGLTAYYSLTSAGLIYIGFEPE